MFLHLYAGRRREEDLQFFLERLASDEDFNLVVVSLDVQVDARKGDLSDPAIVEFWLIEIKRGRVRAAHVAPPCSTWSIARFRHWLPGPRPVRSIHQPWGLDGLLSWEQTAVDLANVLLHAAFQFCLALAVSFGFFSLEHPKEPGEQYPSVWKLDDAKTLLSTPGAMDADFDQCMTGARYQKGTRIRHNMPQLQETLHQRWCNHGPGAHPNLGGMDACGHFNTRQAMEYPPELNRVLAEAVVASIASRPYARAEKVRAPPISEIWTARTGWRLLFQSVWKRQEHQNVLEARTLMNLARHLARSSKRWRRRYLVFTDSLVSLGAFGKGRSSSPALLRLCRRWATVRMVLDIRISLRWAPTDRNLADGPSRRAKIGEHPADDAVIAKKKVKQPRAAAYVGMG